MKTWRTKSGHIIIRILSGRSNVFLLTNGERNILIDTSPNYLWKLLEKRLKKLNVTNIDYLILTHTHADHAENSHRIKEKYKSLVFVHKSEAQYLTTGNNLMPGGTNLLTRVITNSLIKRLYSKYRYEPCQYDYLVDSIFDLKDFGFKAYIIHTPGHSTGSMSVIVDNEVALVGDAMFGIFMRSVFPPFADNIKQMINSWGRLLDTNCSVFIPSHGSADCRSLVQKEYNKRIEKYAQ
jgi:hydroxyacylglutathione hydrolase